MACLSLHWIIDALPILAKSIHSKCPTCLTISQKLIMFFCVNFRLWTFRYANLIIPRGVPLRFSTNFCIANWSHNLQPKTPTTISNKIKKHIPRYFHTFRNQNNKNHSYKFYQWRKVGLLLFGTKENTILYLIEHTIPTPLRRDSYHAWKTKR